MRGATLASLSVSHGYQVSAFSKALKRPWPTVEAIIAKFLDVPPTHIWPSRYDRDGSPRRERSNARRRPTPRLRQKIEVA